MMETPLERRGIAGEEEGATRGVEQGCAAEDYGQGRNVGCSTPANNESDSNSDVTDEEEELPAPLKRKKQRATIGGAHHSERQESDSNTDRSSHDDAEVEDSLIQDKEDNSEDSTIEAVEQRTLVTKKKCEGDGKASLGEDMNSHSATMEEESAAPSLGGDAFRETMESSHLLAEPNYQVLDELAARNSRLEGQLLGCNAETPISVSQRGNQMESLTVSTLESKPSSSQVMAVKNDGSDLLSFDELGSEDSVEADDAYVKKGFTCDGGTEEDDEELREYWTRALQTSTSTGEIVEEIVKVLKHRQKTHDLLCPVCGSCVTRRVILRKRKRSSFISVDRWYHDPLDEVEVEQQEGALETYEEPGVQAHQDIEAFGCLSCFSLFFRKGRELLNQLQADIGPDAFTCLPFFFPPYPWGITQTNSRSIGSHEEGLAVEVAEEVPLLEVQDSPRFMCGIGSTLLPDYPWGTMDFVSKGKPSDQTAVEVVSSTAESSHSLTEGRTCSCGLTPKFLPDYPWGVPNQQIRGVEDPGWSSQSSGIESTCTCGMAQALLPEYQWGHLKKAEDVAFKSPSDLGVGFKDSSPLVPGLSSLSVPEVTNQESVSQPEASLEAQQPYEEGKTCTCALLPALVPDYSWGSSRKDTGNVENRIDMQAKTVQETEGNAVEDKKFKFDPVSAVLPDYPWGMTSQLQGISGDASMHNGVGVLENGAHIRIGSAVLPPYPWGKCSIHRAVHGQNGSVQPGQDAADEDCTCGLGMTMLPEFPWGQTLSTVNKQDKIVPQQEVKNHIEQKTKIETHITSKTDVFTVTSTNTTYFDGKPPPDMKTMVPNKTSQTVQHVKLDQTVTVIHGSVKVDEAAGIKGPPLPSLPSTGFALLGAIEEGLVQKDKLETRPSTGYAYLEELTTEELPISEIEEDPASLKYTCSETKSNSTLLPGEIRYKHGKSEPQPSGTQSPSFEWSIAKLDAGALIEPESQTSVSVLKPSPGALKEPKSDNWVSVFKVSKPSDEGDLTTPLLSPASGYIEEIEEVKCPLPRPQTQVIAEVVIDVPPGDVGRTSVGTTATTVPALTSKKKKEADGWDILKSIVFGGLDISIASLGVTSSAAGGNAITRTVVYMGIATLFSGLIGFYHNVLNLYHYHRSHYVDTVGLTLMLHGTVALISYVVFGLLSPLVYAFSYRSTDDRDDKFILCCGVTIVAVTALALGKAKVSNKRYLRTPLAYLSGGVLAAIVGYLTGEHVAELLEEWGI